MEPAKVGMRAVDTGVEDRDLTPLPSV